MSTESQTNNKRIAKNTILLFARMLVTMGVSLYTSRVILQALGVDDFGIYNLVGGIVAMFGFVTGSLSTATQRFITFEIGKENTGDVKKVFSTCFLLHLIIACAIVLLAEPLGIWFIHNKLLIPADRITAAIWIFQFSLVSTFLMILSVPYNASIVAYEKMGAFAYISVTEAIMKLLIAYALLWTNSDKLIVYGGLLLLTQGFVICLYVFYCKRNFTNIRFITAFKKPILKEISQFAAWSILGNVAYISYTQGLNLLLGMFFMPVVNAARGIAVQIQCVFNTFVLNFQTAINPQITKNYSSGNINEMHQLVYRSSRFSFYLLLLISMPLFIETERILLLWLGEVPEYTVVFVRLILLTTLINSFANPLIIAVKATGKVWQYESVVATLMLMILPVSYILLKCGFDAWVVFAVHLSVEIIAQGARIRISSRLTNYPIGYYLRNVLCNIILTGSISFVLPIVAYELLPDTILSFFIVCFIGVISTTVCITLFGLTKGEISFAKNKIANILHK